jgi:hypothetical protein
VLSGKVFSSKLELVEPIFDARLIVGIRAILLQKFGNDCAKFESFAREKFDNVALFEFHRSGTLQFFPIYSIILPAGFPRGNLKFPPYSSISWGCSPVGF